MTKTPVPPELQEPEDAPSAEGSVSRKVLLRTLLATGGTALAAAVVTGIVTPAARAEGPAPNSTGRRKYRYGMVIDTTRCVGCRSCVLACKQENKTPPGVAYTVVLDSVLTNRANGNPLFMTKPCFHCEKPSCVDVCPVGATFKRSEDGIVAVDYDRCIGCRYCVTACPYGARTFDFGDNYPAIAEGTPLAQLPSPEYNQYRPRRAGESPIGNVRKCTFCKHLQDENGAYGSKLDGRWPACAKTCTGHAIFFGDFNDPTSEVSVLLRERQGIRLKEEIGNSPNVYYLVVR
jgi:molybdopterin-containing oxidoreductase family iron-sulfur binding subunit